MTCYHCDNYIEIGHEGISLHKDNDDAAWCYECFTLMMKSLSKSIDDACSECNKKSKPQYCECVK